MKTRFAALAFILVLPFCAKSDSHVGQSGWTDNVPKSPPAPRVNAAYNREQANIKARVQQREAEAEAEKNEQALAVYHGAYVPEDPWRAISGATNYVRTTGVELAGKIKSISPKGILVSGQFGKLFEMRYRPNQRNTADFLLVNYPYDVATDEVINRHLMAFASGTTEVRSPQGPKTIRRFDYGAPCDVPKWYLDQLAEQQKAKDAAKATETVKLFKYYNDLADKGDSYGQYRTGMNYLNGQGTDKNEASAREYFVKSAAQGNNDAKKELEKMSPRAVAKE